MWRFNHYWNVVLPWYQLSGMDIFFENHATDWFLYNFRILSLLILFSTVLITSFVLFHLVVITRLTKPGSMRLQTWSTNHICSLLLPRYVVAMIVTVEGKLPIDDTFISINYLICFFLFKPPQIYLASPLRCLSFYFHMIFISSRWFFDATFLSLGNFLFLLAFLFQFLLQVC